MRVRFYRASLRLMSSSTIRCAPWPSQPGMQHGLQFPLASPCAASTLCTMPSGVRGHRGSQRSLAPRSGAAPV
jgi:hypothetical protein